MNLRSELKEPNELQRYISQLEISFEAVPELVIQAYFVLNTEEGGALLAMSLVFSLVNIIRTIIFGES